MLSFYYITTRGCYNVELESYSLKPLIQKICIWTHSRTSSIFHPHKSFP